MRNRILSLIALLMLTVLLGGAGASGVQRFPKPEFDTGHELPLTTTPAPRSTFFEGMDVVALAVAMAVTALLVLRQRSRRAVFLWSILCLLYFGFWRKGCVCPIGSIQNVAQAMGDRSYMLSWPILLMFTLPLLFALFFGRVFCAAVCPLGAIQDVVLVRPKKVPVALDRGLRLLPYAYLALAVMLAIPGTRFIICQYDPFVAFFRFGGPAWMVIAGVAMVALSTVVGRPYCRWLCPYSVLLNLCSRLSWKHVSITPDDCIQCRLCEDSCPYDVILYPVPEKNPESRATGVRRIAILLVVLPLVTVGMGWVGSSIAVPLSQQSIEVRTAEDLAAELRDTDRQQSLETETFRKSGTSRESLFAEARRTRSALRTAGWLGGGLLGLALACQLLGLSLRRQRKDYVPDRGACVSCARCFEHCPKEHIRLRGTPAAAKNGSMTKNDG